MIMKLVFDERSYGRKYRTRYWVASIHSDVRGEPEKVGYSHRPIDPDPQNASDESQLLTSASEFDKFGRRKSRMDKLIDMCRSKPSSLDSRPKDKLPSQDFVPLPDESSVQFVLDTKGEQVDFSEYCFDCPDKLENMLVLVRDLREQRQRALAGFRYQASNSATSSSQSSTPSHPQRKRGYDSHRCLNLSDF